jgi:inorganic pyrophosphatase
MDPLSDLKEPLDLIARYQIEPYRSGPDRLRQVAVAFTGAPRKHRRDADKILLLNDPFSEQGFAYEFRAADVVYAEELPNLAMPDGSTVAMARLWVRKGTTALRVMPFHVEDTSEQLWEML